MRTVWSTDPLASRLPSLFHPSVYTWGGAVRLQLLRRAAAALGRCHCRRHGNAAARANCSCDGGRPVRVTEARSARPWPTLRRCAFTALYFQSFHVGPSPAPPLPMLPPPARHGGPAAHACLQGEQRQERCRQGRRRRRQQCRRRRHGEAARRLIPHLVPLLLRCHPSCTASPAARQRRRWAVRLHGCSGATMVFRKEDGLRDVVLSALPASTRPPCWPCCPEIAAKPTDRAIAACFSLYAATDSC